MKFKDLTGQRHGRLLILNRAEDRAFPCGQKLRQWNAKCDCGKEVVVLATNLARTRSCGCLNSQEAAKRTRARATHGISKHYIYGVFRRAQTRCNNPKAAGYKDYGGRGIKFKFSTPEEILVEMGPRPTPKHTIDRINNDGHYEPGNVKWATKSEQARNRRRGNLMISVAAAHTPEANAKRTATRMRTLRQKREKKIVNKAA